MFDPTKMKARSAGDGDAPVAPLPAEPQSLEEFGVVVERANAGSKQALAVLRKTLDERPGLWSSVGDMAAVAERVAVEAIANGDRFLEESLVRKAADSRAELAADTLGTLERMAIARVVACSMLLDYVSTLFFRAG